MTNPKKLLKRTLPPKAIIGMIHVLPLPGSVWWEGNIQNLLQRSQKELEIYKDEGVDAVMLENMFDAPYSKPPLAQETVAAMIRIAKIIRKKTMLPIGVQMLEGANCEAMKIAAKADLDFVRVEGFVYAHIGGAGLIEGSARKILELRKKLNAQHIQIFSDAKKKHCAHALTGDLSLGDIVKQSDFFCTDGTIVTGNFTGEPASFDDLIQAKKAAPHLPLLVGSGIDLKNLNDFFHLADGFIVGTYFKENGLWKNPVSAKRVRDLVKLRNKLYNK